MPNIKEFLINFNPWWSEGYQFQFNFIEREQYPKIIEFIQERQIIALSGLRRVGKTTILLKLVEDQMGRYGARKIIYFSFDEFKNAELREIINAYEEITEFRIQNGKYLLLLDELQKLDNWQNQLKTIYDLYPNVKIVISGSESLFIRRIAKESLAGRLFEFKIKPLTFKEFLLFKKINFRPIGLHERELLQLFDKYTIMQGFPELVDKEEKTDFIKKYINEGIIEKVIYTDIPKLFKIENPETLERIMDPILDDPGQIIELNSLSRELNISRQTLSLYLRYLEDSFLIKKLYNFSKNKRKIERKLKKYYPAVVSEELLLKNDDLSRSKALEWIVIRLLEVEFFWKDAQKHEVDAVVADGTPIEIKYGKIGTDGIEAFNRKFKPNNSLIISKNRKEKLGASGKMIEVVPAYEFFLRG